MFKVSKGAAHAVLGLLQINRDIIASAVNKKVWLCWSPTCMQQDCAAYLYAGARDSREGKCQPPCAASDDCI